MFFKFLGQILVFIRRSVLEISVGLFLSMKYGGSEWSRSVAGNKKGVHPCNGRMRNNDPAMSTVISMIRESLITFQTFACRTRIRAQR